jgi:hypothetical protein
MNHIKILDRENETVSQKKAELAPFQQGQINHHLDSLTIREKDRNFQWLLAQLDRIERPAEKNKDKRETITMLVFF